MNNNLGTLNKVLSGINNTLSIANKALPIVKEAKPIINTAKETISTFKSTGNDIQKMFKLMKVKNQIKKDMNNTIKEEAITQIKSITNNSYPNINNPKFFI